MEHEQKSEYEEDLSLDKYGLHVECEVHSSNYIKWSERLAQAAYERDVLKESIDTQRAKLDQKIRANPDLYFDSDKKPTEASITATINVNDKIIALNEELNKKNFNVNILSNVKAAFDHKKKMLELETSLYLNGYFSNPKVDSRLAEEDKEKTDEAISKALSKNTRLLKKKG